MTNIARNQKNILLVEDDFILAMDAEDAIRSAGLEVSVVDNVDDALKVLESEKIDAEIGTDDRGGRDRDRDRFGGRDRDRRGRPQDSRDFGRGGQDGRQVSALQHLHYHHIS